LKSFLLVWARSRRWRSELKQAKVNSLLRPEVPVSREFVLRHRGRGIAVGGDVEDTSGYLLIGGIFTSDSRGTHDSVGAWNSSVRRMVFPQPRRDERRRESQADEIRVDASWLRDADLLIVESRYVGRVMRSWSATDVPIATEPVQYVPAKVATAAPPATSPGAPTSPK
jgi:hypothetical protein